ncbi:MAG TPA: AMP-binding protein [Nitriliruptorales bacterium]
MGGGSHHLAALADEAFERFGDRPEALCFEGRWYSSGELHRRLAPIAGGLVELGVEPGDRVVVFMANTPEVGVLYNAIWRAGAVATPTIFLLPPPELRHVLADSGAKVIVTTPEFLLTVQFAADGVDALEHIVCVGLDTVDEVPGPRPVTDFAQVEGGDPIGIVARTDDDLAGLLYTGGTTGRSKGVMQTHGAFWTMAKAAVDHSYREGITRSLMPLPLSHAYGLGITIAAAHQREPGTSVLMRWFDPAEALDLIERHGLQRALLVPSMLQMLLGQDLESHDLSTLVTCNSGAAPLGVQTIRELERRLPWVEVLEGYGLTESATFAAANQPGNRRVGTVGRPMPGVELRTVDDDGQDVDEGETGAAAGETGAAAGETGAAAGETGVAAGEIWVRSPGVMKGYWNDPEATAAAVTGDGWLRTGDIGRLDEDGFLTILDRKKDLIIRGGFNVYPSDVEDALVEHPAVAMAGVVGAPDAGKGEEVVAFVQLVEGATITPDELVAWSRDRLGGYKYPRRVHLVDAIPLTPVMKLDRKALRARLADVEPASEG